MRYILHFNKNSTAINRLMIFFPGLDEVKSSNPATTNSIEKYDIVAKLLTEICGDGTAAIVLEYLGPHAWGDAIDSKILTNDIAETLKASLKELRTKFLVDLKNIDLAAHSYGFTALSMVVANNTLGNVLGADYNAEINVSLFEPYGIAAMKSAKQNTPEFREHDLVAFAQQNLGLNIEVEPVDIAAQELNKLREANNNIKDISIILGQFRPWLSIHDSYGKINSKALNVQLSKLDGVGHGGALLDIYKATKDNQVAPGYAISGFQLLMNAWISALQKPSIDHRIIELTAPATRTFLPRYKVSAPALCAAAFATTAALKLLSNKLRA